MREVVVSSFVTLDGVMQAPGGHEKDSSGGFEHGGRLFDNFGDSDVLLDQAMEEQASYSFDLLLGRKACDNFAFFWPRQDEKASIIVAAVQQGP